MTNAEKIADLRTRLAALTTEIKEFGEAHDPETCALAGVLSGALGAAYSNRSYRLLTFITPFVEKELAAMNRAH